MMEKLRRRLCWRDMIDGTERGTLNGQSGMSNFW